MQEPLIHFSETITPGPVLTPHPARVILTADPNHPAITLECHACGELWECPAHGPKSSHAGEPATEIYGNEITSCPGCGCRTELTLQIKAITRS